MHLNPSNKLLNVTFWIAQLFLALIFGSSGILKATGAVADLHSKLPWTTALPDLMVRFIGTCELLGAIGLILPALTRIKPQLTPWAATGLATIMILASGFHLTRGEGAYVPSLLGVALIAAAVAWGRFKRIPIAPR